MAVYNTPLESPQIRAQPHLIPLDIQKDLPDLLVPWKISDSTFSKMRARDGEYKIVEVLPTDPEWRFIWRYFYYDKPLRFGIGRVYCIYDTHEQQAFESGLSCIEKDAEKFPASWKRESKVDQRAQAIERWKEATQIFSSFKTFENGDRQRDLKEAKILPLWCPTTYQHFASTCGGFGTGFYFSNSARYVSDICGLESILMSWVSMKEPFPVVGDPNQEDMKLLKDKGAYKHYNAHYIPVTSADPLNPNKHVYYPTKQGEKPHCDEIVVFQKSQVLSRFCIKLILESPTLRTLSATPQSVQDMTPHLFKILEHPEVDKDEHLRNYLNQVLAFLLKLEGHVSLSDLGGKYGVLYEYMTQLIVQGKVNHEVSRLITELNLHNTESFATPLMTQQPQYMHFQPHTEIQLRYHPYSLHPPFYQGKYLQPQNFQLPLGIPFTQFSQRGHFPPMVPAEAYSLVYPTGHEAIHHYPLVNNSLFNNNIRLFSQGTAAQVQAHFQPQNPPSSLDNVVKL